MDKICIRRLGLCYHGVFEEEKRLGQKFSITAELELDTRKAGVTDDLQASVNYGEVCQRMAEWTKKNRRKLIEAAAEDLARYLLLQYPMVRKVTLELEKPGAPVPYALIRYWFILHRALLGIGSNLGDRQMNLRRHSARYSAGCKRYETFIADNFMTIRISRRLSMDALKDIIHRKASCTAS
ncbi:MAG: dihydroneopterin aldolase [Coprococcus sp.]